MNKKKSFFSGLADWVDGERQPELRMGWKNYEVKRKIEYHRPEEQPKDTLARFFRRYRAAVAVALAVLLAALLLLAVSMPPFGSDENPVNNEVVERYVGSAEEETGAENVIAGMILNYRGFDTFGESSVLFLAVCCVMMLLWSDENCSSETERELMRREEELEEPDMILSCVSRLLIPCLLCFGLSVLAGGHVSPGGGFSGGSVLGATLILFSVALGADKVRRFFTARVFNVVRISGLTVYALMFGVYIFFGANGIESELSRYIVLVIDVAVGLVVMSTMYGFYSFYTKGDL